MDKRLAKRHKRQVARAREKVRLSEPDVRTPEEMAAAKAASRPDIRRDANHPWPTLPVSAPEPEKAGDSEPPSSSPPPKP